MAQLYIITGIVGLSIIVWLFFTFVSSAKRLDRRLEEYHRENPPADPYGELVKLMSEDYESRPGPKRIKNRSIGESN